ncbi:MAG: protease inhibitor I42 family protein [Bacteroidales bacterium]|nr:protease inhibitor I42 family protein [Bacteroidales bacterium]MBN2750864.1 protease inhibitor I42 family protein [Bacteroidales bacterium]
MSFADEILLDSQRQNRMRVNGELGWFIQECNALAGYVWRCISDNSGVYELIEEVMLQPSISAEGALGKQIWIFSALKAGEGQVRFELYPPGASTAIKQLTVYIIAG